MYSDSAGRAQGPVRHAGDSPPFDPVARAGLREQVSQRLLSSVFKRQFPSGSRLIVRRLAERFGVSPTPVREALVELAGLGIVDLLPNRGAVVKPFGAEELGHISQIRRVLETEACRSSCGRIEQAALRDLRDQFNRLRKMPQNDAWDRTARSLDSRLHRLIADSTANPRLGYEIKRYLSLFRSMRNISHLRDSMENYRRSNDVPEHLQIVEALIAGNRQRAADAMDRHIRSITSVLTDLVFPQSAAKAMTDRRSRRSRKAKMKFD
jgi:DNA-binding GntR family transcriptional regulator